jgi:hypothetical protein
MDPSIENIARIEGENNRKLYNSATEIEENLPMRDIYNCTPTVGECSFQFMPNCGFIESENLHVWQRRTDCSAHRL